MLTLPLTLPLAPTLPQTMQHAQNLKLTLDDGSKNSQTVSVDASGNFVVSVKEGLAGIYRFALSAPADTQFLASTSGFATVVVR